MRYEFHPAARLEFREAVTLESGYIHIIARMHGNRQPSYWRNRISA